MLLGSMRRLPLKGAGKFAHSRERRLRRCDPPLRRRQAAPAGERHVLQSLTFDVAQEPRHALAARHRIEHAIHPLQQGVLLGRHPFRRHVHHVRGRPEQPLPAPPPQSPPHDAHSYRHQPRPRRFHAVNGAQAPRRDPEHVLNHVLHLVVVPPEQPRRNPSHIGIVTLEDRLEINGRPRLSRRGDDAQDRLLGAQLVNGSCPGRRKTAHGNRLEWPARALSSFTAPEGHIIAVVNLEGKLSCAVMAADRVIRRAEVRSGVQRDEVTANRHHRGLESWHVRLGVES